MALVVALVALGAAAGALGIRVWRVCHPARVVELDRNIAIDIAAIEDVRIAATDGTDIAGWLFHGPDGAPPIVLCHDLGASKSTLVNVAIALQKKGFTVLAIDFRGHGQSAGTASSLGVLEKRDVLGAIDYVASLPEVDARRIGVYGTGMGAHAAVLAAADRASVRVLVLDGMVPNAGWLLARRVYGDWSFGVKRLGFVARAAFHVVGHGGSDDETAADRLPRLEGRSVLLVAPAADAALADVLDDLYRRLPEHRDAEANLITLARTAASGVFGEGFAVYDERIGSFFETRLRTR